MSISMICAVAPLIAVVIGIVALVAGGALGAFLYRIIATKKLGKSKSNAVRIIEEAYAEAKTIKKEASLEAKEESQKYREQIDNEIKDRRSEVIKAEERLNEREKFIENKELSLDKKSEQLEEDKKSLGRKKKRKSKQKIEEQETIKNEILSKLEKISGYSKADAKKRTC